MEYVRQKALQKSLERNFDLFLDKLWFVPSDVLQRGVEATLWQSCNFRHPILDIGIGNGEMSLYLFKKDLQIDVGIDLDDSQFDKAKATGKYKKVQRANAAKLPFKDASFATVVSNSTFEHISSDIRAVTEVSRVLKKDGLFYLTVPSNFLKMWIPKEKLEAFNKRANHLHYHSLEQWETIFRKNNLELVYYQYYFPYDVAIYWYKLFYITTSKFRNRELWSYLGHSRISSIILKKVVIFVLKQFVLKDAFQKALFTNNKYGAQLFMVLKK